MSSGWTKFHEAMRKDVGLLPKCVLVVEGPDDKNFVESLLDRRAPGAWQAQWMIGVAGGKTNVAKILGHEPAWHGLVDRDEWTQSDMVAHQAKFPGRLHILSRFCVESYFVIPNELWLLLPPARQAQITGGREAFETVLLSEHDTWLRHGALWHTINPLWAGLRSLGFKDELLDMTNATKTDAQIEAKLDEWHRYLEPGTIMQAFRDALAAARGVSIDEQLKMRIHGKKFFEMHINSELSRLLSRPSQSAEKTLAELGQGMIALPPDLVPVWNAIGLP